MCACVCVCVLQGEPESAELPSEWESKCNELQRLLLVRCLRPDRVVFAATGYASSALGRRFVEPPVLDLGETLNDSTAQSPLIFVLSAGVDPTEPLRKLAAVRTRRCLLPNTDTHMHTNGHTRASTQMQCQATG